MNLRQLRAKTRRLNKLKHEIVTADLSESIGLKVKLSKTCVDWYKKYADQLGMPYEEMEIITSNQTATIVKVAYCPYDNDGYTITIDFGTLTLRVGLEDIRILNERKS